MVTAGGGGRRERATVVSRLEELHRAGEGTKETEREREKLARSFVIFHTAHRARTCQPNSERKSVKAATERRETRSGARRVEADSRESSRGVVARGWSCRARDRPMSDTGGRGAV